VSIYFLIEGRESHKAFDFLGCNLRWFFTGTADQYQLGALGDKYGLLEDMKSINTFYNETQLTLYGPYSILGRSVVLHKKVTGF
jgi:hypothetical protein